MFRQRKIPREFAGVAIARPPLAKKFLFVAAAGK
jgi:hypothetical protein